MDRGFFRRFLLVSLMAVALGAACDDEKRAGSGPAVSVAVSRAEMGEELANRVLARVGDRTITLGDYVTALERMDRFERLRYQTPERRRLLLDEMIHVELLAREAERRGLDEEAKTQAHILHLAKEHVLRRLRAGLPSVEGLPLAEVRAYYEAHKTEFADPERRRVAVIKLRSKRRAAKVLAEARSGDAKRWGELARKYSQLAPAQQGNKNVARPPLELAGDLGLVTASPGPGDTSRVPAAVRAAVFKVQQPGEVYPEVVSESQAYYVVRLLGKSRARARSFPEAENVIRAQLLEARIKAAEDELRASLRRETHVVVNQELLPQLKVGVPEKPATR